MMQTNVNESARGGYCNDGCVFVWGRYGRFVLLWILWPDVAVQDHR